MEHHHKVWGHPLLNDRNNRCSTTTKYEVILSLMIGTSSWIMRLWGLPLINDVSNRGPLNLILNMLAYFSHISIRIFNPDWVVVNRLKSSAKACVPMKRMPMWQSTPFFSCLVRNPSMYTANRRIYRKHVSHTGNMYHIHRTCITYREQVSQGKQVSYIENMYHIQRTGITYREQVSYTENRYNI